MLKYGWLFFLCFCAFVQAETTALRFSQQDVIQVARRPFFQSIEGLGTVEARSRATLSTTISAPLMYVNRHIGQVVTKGTLLARLDDALLQRQLMSQQASYRSALLQLNKDHRHFQNGLRLYEHRFLSRTAFEDLLSQYQASDAAAAVIDASIRQTRLNIARTRVVAPFDGVISAAPAELGQTINAGQAIISMVDPASFQAKIQVPVSSLPDIHLGDVVSFDYPKGLGHGTGHVRFIAPQLTNQSQTLVIYSDLLKKTRFFPEGIFLKAHICSRHRTEALVMPVEALHDDAKGYYVYRIGPHQRIERVEVHIGLSFDGWIAITQGLQAGDWIVSRDLGPLSVGQPVSVDKE